MSRGDHALEIQIVLRRNLAQLVRSKRDILERVGPDAAFVADTAILDAPDSEAAVGERLLELSRVRDVKCREPASTVDEDDDGMRSRRLGYSEVGELERRWTVR